MKKKLIISSLLVIFLILVVPNVSSIEYNSLVKTKGKILSNFNNNDNILMDNPFLQIIRIILAFYLLYGTAVPLSIGISLFLSMFIIVYNLFAGFFFIMYILTGSWSGLVPLFELMLLLFELCIPAYYLLFIYKEVLESWGETSFIEAYNYAKSKHDWILNKLLLFICKPT